MLPIIAIDGPSGSGKGTIARRVATTLGFHLLDSGALYRLVALAGLRRGLAADDEAGHAVVARTLDVEFGVDEVGEERVWLAGEVVTAEIRTEAAGGEASRVAAMPTVRAALLDRQRAFARPPGLVADGRDMGTVVFPEAPLKIYLTASPEERALRRYNQLKTLSIHVNLSNLVLELREPFRGRVRGVVNFYEQLAIHGEAAAARHVDHGPHKQARAEQQKCVRSERP